MDLVKVMETFSTQEDCIAYLERLRWAGASECPHCKSLQVRRRNETAVGRIGRWNCHDCRATFKVTHGTMFHGEPKNPATEVVSRNLTDGKCEKKSIESSTCSRFRVETESGLVSDDEDTCRDGEGKRDPTRSCRSR